MAHILRTDLTNRPGCPSPQANMMSNMRVAIRLAAYVCLLAASFTLPFELKDSLFRIGPLNVTSTEIGIYLTVGFCCLAWSSGIRRNWKPAHLAVAAWGAVVLISALFAETNRAAAMKFALRNFGGCALFFAASDLAEDRASAARIGAALVAGSTISAFLALAEMWIPGMAAVLMRFKTQASWVGSFMRASGTFQYANIASMYWEATLPLALAIPLVWRHAGYAKKTQWLGLGMSVVLIEAIILSASRAGLLIAAASLAILTATSSGSLRPLRTSAGILLACLSVFFAVDSFSTEVPLLRFSSRGISAWYSARFLGFPVDMTLEAEQLRRVAVTVLNQSRMKWRPTGPQAVSLSYHWLDPATKNTLIWNGAQTELPCDVEPGGKVTVQAWVFAPPGPGTYVLQWDMVQRNVAWFSMYSVNRDYMPVHVVPRIGGQAGTGSRPPTAVPIVGQPSRLELWRAALRLWREKPFWGVGPDNFRYLRGRGLMQQGFDDRIHANNLYLETLANIGLVGILALGGIMACLASSCWNAWKCAGLAEDKLLTLGVSLALTAYFAHGMADYFLPFTPTYGLFWILAGLSTRLRWDR